MLLYQLAFLVIIFTFGECSNRAPSRRNITQDERCSNNEVPPLAVAVESCRNPPCQFQIGKPYSLQMSFQPHADTYKLLAKTQVVRDGQEPNTVLESNLCNKLQDGDRCPVRDMKNYYVEDEIRFDDEKLASDDLVNVQYRVIGQNDRTAICFSVPAYIKDS